MCRILKAGPAPHATPQTKGKYLQFQKFAQLQCAGPLLATRPRFLEPARMLAQACTTKLCTILMIIEMRPRLVRSSRCIRCRRLIRRQCRHRLCIHTWCRSQGPLLRAMRSLMRSEDCSRSFLRYDCLLCSLRDLRCSTLPFIIGHGSTKLHLSTI